MRKFKNFMLTAFVSVIMLIAANTVYSGMNPPLGDFNAKTTGPAIVGEITIIDDSENNPSSPLLISFDGECKTDSSVNLLEQNRAVPQLVDEDGNIIAELTFDVLKSDIDLLEGWVMTDVVGYIYTTNCYHEKDTLFGVVINTINSSYVFNVDSDGDGETDTEAIKAKAILLPAVYKY